MHLAAIKSDCFDLTLPNHDPQVTKRKPLEDNLRSHAAEPIVKIDLGPKSCRCHHHGVLRCKLMHRSVAMPATSSNNDCKSVHRLSVSLTAEQHRELNEIAQRNRVSVAWVVREAIDRLLKDDMPLLHVGKE